METWLIISEFPSYRVSNYGRVLNDATGRILKHSETRTGLVKVGLVSGGIQHTRSIALLVADAFVPGKDELFDTPIHLDGDKHNNYAENLMWRPRWFAWKFTRQFNDDKVHRDRGPVMDVDNGEVYSSFLEVAAKNGVLFEDIWKCVVYKKRVFPTNQSFRLIT